MFSKTGCQRDNGSSQLELLKTFARSCYLSLFMIVFIFPITAAYDKITIRLIAGNMSYDITLGGFFYQ